MYPKAVKSECKRRTPQQALVRSVFQAAGRPLTAAETHQIALHKKKNIGIATVYRIIRSMLEEQQLNQVMIAGEPPYYEYAPVNHHHYFHCCDCRRVYVLSHCPLSLDEITPKGFHTEWHDVVLHGQCMECRSIGPCHTSDSCSCYE